MGEFAMALLATSFFKIALILSGTASTYMGFLLFREGFSESKGKAEGEGHGVTFKMENVGPGVFFALFGTILIGITAYKGMEVTLPGGVKVFSSPVNMSAAEASPVLVTPPEGGTIRAH